MIEEKIASKISALKDNVKHEKEILKEISSIQNHLATIDKLKNSGYKINEDEKKLLENTINSLISQIKIINDSNPNLLKEISLFKEIHTKKTKHPKQDLVSFKYNSPVTEADRTMVTVNKTQKDKFIKELSLTDSSINKLKKKYSFFEEHKKDESFKKPSAYAKLSNRIFSETSKKMVRNGYFADLNKELRKSNMPFLSHTYISMSFFTALLSLAFAFFLLVILLFFSLSPLHFFELANENPLIRLLKNFWILIAFPIATFFTMIYYPSIEKKAIERKINQEIPFVTIHMAAIAGSNIEPTNIFSIIVSGQEYPYTKREIKKVLNQVNLYGYDLVSALRSSASMTSSSKLSELFSGFATTITSGGNLEMFLTKRADTLIFDFKTESEKSIKSAETFMDIYISVVIAAPMILMLILVMMGMNKNLIPGVDTGSLGILIILAVALINIVFIMFLHVRQQNS